MPLTSAVGWGTSAALRLKDWEQWIGWDEPTRRRHLDRVVGMSHFLIRPDVKCHNLASRVLRSVQRQIADDFEAKYTLRPWRRDLREILQARLRAKAKTIAHYARQCETRNQAIAAAYASGGHTMQRIGDFFGPHYSRVSKIINAADHANPKSKGKTQLA